MALTAVITAPVIGVPGVPDPYIFTGYSYVRFHGYNTQLAGQTKKIVDYTWSWGDGSSFTYGPVASHRYLTSGTYTVTLIVTDTDGTISQTTTTVVVQDWNAAWGTIYVSAAGNDTTGNGTIGNPYRSPLKAFQVAWDSKVKGQPKKILLNRGDTYSYTGNGGDASRGTFTRSSICDTYGSGAKPVINVSEGIDIVHGNDSNSHDWGWTTAVVDWKFVWPTPSQSVLSMTTAGSSWIRAEHVNGTFEATDGNFPPIKITFDGCDATGHLGIPGGGGIGFSNAGSARSTFFGVLNCNCHGNSANRATNAYFHGDIFEVRGNTFDTENNGVTDALLMSGCQKYLVMNNVFSGGTNSCLSAGSNGSTDGSAEAQDCWIEGNFATALGTGIDLHYTNRGVVKNNVINGCSVGIFLTRSHDPYTTEYTQNIDVIGNTIIGATNQSIWTNGVRTIRFRNNGITKTNSVPGGGGDSHFVQLGQGSQNTQDDYLYVTCDGNGYYDPLVTSSTDYAFVFNNGNKTFVQWQAQGYDTTTTAAFGQNPLFKNAGAGDYSLQSGSPWINAGVATPELYRDYTTVARSSIDSTVDIGAFEFTTGQYTGTGNGQLGRVVGDGDAQIGQGGSGGGVFKKMTSTGTGTIGYVGQTSCSGGAALAALVGAGTGGTDYTGSGSGLLDGLTAAGVGALQTAGSGNGVLARMTAQGTGAVGSEGSGAGVLPALVGVGVGQTSTMGTGAGVLRQLVAAGQGGSNNGSGDGALARMQGGGVGVTGITGAGVGVFQKMTGSGVGGLFTGTGAGVLRSLLASGVGDSNISGSGGGTLRGMQASGVGGYIEGVGDGPLRGMIGSGLAFFGTVAEGTALLQGVAASGVGSVYIVTGTGTGVLGSLVGDGEGGGNYGTGDGVLGGLVALGEVSIALVVDLSSDMFVSSGQQGGTGTVLIGATDSPSSGTLSFRIGDVYLDVQNHRPLRVIAIGGTITFQVISNPKVPGVIISMSLQRARTLVLQRKLRRIS